MTKDTPNQNTNLLRNVVAEQLVQAANISSLQNTIDDQAASLKKLTDGMTRILTLIDNDNATGTPGIVERTRNNENKIADINNKITSFNTKLTTTGSLIVLFATVGSWLISFFYNR